MDYLYMIGRLETMRADNEATGAMLRNFAGFEPATTASLIAQIDLALDLLRKVGPEFFPRN